MTRLIGQQGVWLSPAGAQALLRTEVANIFSLVLQDAGVFKYSNDGIRNFCKFMNTLGLTERAGDEG